MSDLILATRPCPQLFNGFAAQSGLMGVHKMVLYGSARDQDPGAYLSNHYREMKLQVKQSIARFTSVFIMNSVRE